MNEDGVTIVIASRDHEAFLPQSISSALRGVEALGQHGVPAEVAVVDDRSRDGSPVLLRQLEAVYHSRGLRLFPGAEGRLLAVSRYRYAVLMEAVGELVPEGLPVALRALRETASAAAFGNLLVRDAGAPAARDVLGNRSVQPSAFTEDYLGEIAMVDRLRAADTGCFGPAGTTAEDPGPLLRLAALGRKVVFVPVVFGYLNKIIDGEDHGEDGSCRRRLDRRASRILDRAGARAGLPLATNCLRYHPDLGHL